MDPVNTLRESSCTILFHILYLVIWSSFRQTNARLGVKIYSTPSTFWDKEFFLLKDPMIWKITKYNLSWMWDMFSEFAGEVDL